LTRRRGRRRKQPLDDLKERRVYYKLKKKQALDGTVEKWLWKRLWTCRKTD